MDRQGHYLKPGVRATAPTHVFSVVCSPTVEPSGPNGSDAWLTWGGADVCVSHWRGRKWSPVRGARCETPEALHDWLEEHAVPGERNYVFSPNAAETAAMSQLWDRIDTGAVRYVPFDAIHPRQPQCRRDTAATIFRRVVLSPRTTILDYTRAGVRWLWLNGRQYLDMTEHALSKLVGEPWRDTGSFDDDDSHTAHTTEARAYLWLRAFQALADWWRKASKAPWGMTAAGLSLGVLRSHVEEKAICTHKHPWVHQLERDACFGGRQSVWYYGDVGDPRKYGTRRNPAPPWSRYGSIPGPLYQLDVRSMYPWLLRERQYPTKLIWFKENIEPKYVLDRCHSFGLIARVTVETEVPEYPLRTDGGIVYPVGRFVTTLTGPELLRIAQDGRIAAVHAAACYMLGSPFTAAAGALIAMREGNRDSDHPEWEMFAKHIGNALVGRLAIRRGEWVHCPRHPAAVRYGEWYGPVKGVKGRQHLRALAGIVWRYQPDASGEGPYTAAFAYCTAYGRLHMRGIRDACPVRSVVSMDTDGVWVRASALPALRYERSAKEARAGSLRLVDTVPAAIFLGPQHYFTSAGWVLSGFSHPLVSHKGTRVGDTQRHTPCGDGRGEAPRGVWSKQRTSALAVESRGCVVDAGGWATARRRRGTL